MQWDGGIRPSGSVWRVFWRVALADCVAASASVGGTVLRESMFYRFNTIVTLCQAHRIEQFRESLKVHFQ